MEPTNYNCCTWERWSEDGSRKRIVVTGNTGRSRLSLVCCLLWTMAIIPVVRSNIRYPVNNAALERLAEQEEIIYGILSECWERHTNPGALENYTVGHSMEVNMYLEDYETSTGMLSRLEPEKDSVGVPGNPLASLKMLFRFVTLLPPLANSGFPCPEYTGFVNNSFNETVRWPNAEDVEENIMRILRLQQVYNLKTEEVADGILGTVSTKIKLSSSQTYEIGLVAFMYEMYTFAFQWLELTRGRLAAGTEQGAGIEQRVGRALKNVMEEHDRTWSNLTGMDMEYHYHELLLGNPTTSPKVTKREIIMETKVKHHLIKYWKLCSGENFQSPAELSKLFCWLERKAHPFWTLGPLKMELLSRRPDVVQVHELLGQGLMDRILTTGLGGMVLSRINFSINHEEELASRTSLQAWVNDFSSPELRAASQIAEMMTGLRVATARASEDLQVLSYSFGGHVEPHVDCLDKVNCKSELETLGDRVLTVQYYLSNVQSGGATAFTAAGMSAEPVRGSAVFWYGLYNDGTCDRPAGMHGGCPVILGRKYAATKFVHYFDQFPELKCGLTPGEPIRPKINGEPLL